MRSGGALGDMPSGVAWELFKWPPCGKSRGYSGGVSGEHHWRLLREYARGAAPGRSDPRTENLHHEIQALLIIRLFLLITSIFS